MYILFLGLSFFICMYNHTTIICEVWIVFLCGNHVLLVYNMTKLLINFTRILCPDSLDRRMDAMEDTRE